MTADNTWCVYKHTFPNGKEMNWVKGVHEPIFGED